MSDAAKTQESSRFFWMFLCGTTLLAVVLRLLYLDRIAPEIPGMSDADGYYQMGGYLAEGMGFIQYGFRYGGEAVPTAAYAPLLPGLLALLRLVGVESIEVQRGVVAVLGALTIPLVGLLARRIAGSAVGIVSATLAALSPNLIEIDGAMMTEGLYTLLMTAALVMAARSYGAGVSMRWFLVGALVGFAGLTRSEALLFFALLFLPIAWVGSRGTRLRDVAGLVLGLFLVVAPWTTRNAVVQGAFVPIAHSYKGVVLGANCAGSYSEKHRGSWSFSCVQAVDTKGLGEAEAFERYRDVGIDYALDHVSDWPAVATARVLRTWGFYRPGTWFGYGSIEVRDPDFYRATQSFGWGLLLVAAFGLVPLIRRDPARAWLLAAPIAIVTFTSMVGYGNPRFRAAAEPGLSILAAMAMVDFWKWIRDQSA